VPFPSGTFSFPFLFPPQPTLPFQVMTDPVRQGMRQLRQFSAGGFIDPVETGPRSIGASEIDAIQEQHVAFFLATDTLYCSASVSGNKK